MLLSNNVKIPELVNKWKRVLDLSEGQCAPVTDRYKRMALSVILENQHIDNKDSLAGGFSSQSAYQQALTEAAPANAAGSVGGTFPQNPNMQGYDPVLISLVRRVMPRLIAFDIAGVQPLNAPTGLIFAMKSKYTSQGGAEALHFEADTTFSGDGTHTMPLDPMTLAALGTGMSTYDGEKLGGVGEPAFNEMAMSIEKVTVEAKTRALKAEYTMELANDLKAVHGLDAETELANILSAEILTEMNREFIRTVYYSAVTGAQYTTVPGTIDLDLDTDGRWLVEKFKGMMFLLEKEANQIAKRTRRGRGNWILCTSDVAAALSVAGLLDYGTNLKDSLNVDDTGDTYVGTLNGRFKVYIDPYVVGSNFMVVGFKGNTPYDAGMYFCPYVPLQMARAVGQDNFQPRIAFKTRYGLVANPFSRFDGTVVPANNIQLGTNEFFRKMAVTKL